MRKSWTTTLCTIAVLAGVTLSGLFSGARAQTEFKAALEKKYDRKITVTCNACHVQGEEKTTRNDFGKLFAKALEGKNVTKRLAEIKDLDADDAKRVKVKDEVSKEFLEALKKVEEMKSKDGATYADLIKTGKQEGIKLKE
jgi:hypothetical protein